MDAYILTLKSEPTRANAYRCMGQIVLYPDEESAEKDRQLFIAPGRQDLYIALPVELNGFERGVKW